MSGLLGRTNPTCHTLDAEVYLPGPEVIGGGGAHGPIHGGIQASGKSSEGSCRAGILSQSLPNCSYDSACQFRRIKEQVHDPMPYRKHVGELAPISVKPSLSAFLYCLSKRRRGRDYRSPQCSLIPRCTKIAYLFYLCQNHLGFSVTLYKRLAYLYPRDRCVIWCKPSPGRVITIYKYYIRVSSDHMGTAQYQVMVYTVGWVLVKYKLVTKTQNQTF